MNIINIGSRREKWEDREIPLLINEEGSSLIIYELISATNVEYRIKNRNNIVIAEFDNKLNRLGDIKTLVNIEEYNKALKKLEEYHQFSLEIDRQFGFDKIEAQMILEGKMNEDGSINEQYTYK